MSVRPPPMPDWYVEWYLRFQTAFGLSQEWCESAVTWWRFWHAEAVTAAELDAAILSVMQGGKPAKWDVMDRVKTAVFAARDKVRAAEREARRAAEEADDMGTCTDCGDSGTIVVPHPRFVRLTADGRWEWVPETRGYPAGRPKYHEAGAYCGCVRGRRQLADRQAAMDRAGVPGQPWSIGGYQTRVCPDWQELVARRLAAAAGEREAADAEEAIRRRQATTPRQVVDGLLARMAG